MSGSINPTQANVFASLGNFCVSVLPSPIVVQQGQVNRVAEPAAADFVVMWPLSMPRLSTNIDDYADGVFTGSIAAGVMAITAVNPNFTGRIAVGSSIFGSGVALNTRVLAFGTGSGGVGTYTVSPSQTVSSRSLAAGTQIYTQEAKATVQLDVHGPNAMNNAGLISTMFRDAYAVDNFELSGFGVVPLYCEDPRQMPFLDAEQQYENRWSIDCHMQVNLAVVLPQQFASVLALDLIDVDVVYPPT